MTKFVHNGNVQLVGCSFCNNYVACSKECAKIAVNHHGNNNGVIPPILQAMKHHPTHKQLQTCAIRALSTICCTKTTATTPQGGGGGGGGGVAFVFKAGGFSALVRAVETIELDEETTKLAKKAIAQLNSYLQKNDTYACVLAREA